jgi:hypothetical protein
MLRNGLFKRCEAKRKTATVVPPCREADIFDDL